MRVQLLDRLPLGRAKLAGGGQPLRVVGAAVVVVAHKPEVEQRLDESEKREALVRWPAEVRRVAPRSPEGCRLPDPFS